MRAIVADPVAGQLTSSLANFQAFCAALQQYTHPNCRSICWSYHRPGTQMGMGVAGELVSSPRSRVRPIDL